MRDAMSVRACCQPMRQGCHAHGARPGLVHHLLSEHPGTTGCQVGHRRERVGGASPQHAHRELSEDRIGGDERKRLEHRLGRQHPVEGIPMSLAQLAGEKRVRRADGELLCSQGLEVGLVAKDNGLRLAQAAYTVLGCHLPSRSGGDDQAVRPIRETASRDFLMAVGRLPERDERYRDPGGLHAVSGSGNGVVKRRSCCLYMQASCYTATMSGNTDNEFVIRGPQSFGMALREFRTSRSVSQAELAERSGIHRSYLSSLERGSTTEAVRYVIAACRALDLEIVVRPRRGAG